MKVTRKQLKDLANLISETFRPVELLTREKISRDIKKFEKQSLAYSKDLWDDISDDYFEARITFLDKNDNQRTGTIYGVSYPEINRDNSGLLFHVMADDNNEEINIYLHDIVS